MNLISLRSPKHPNMVIHRSQAKTRSLVFAYLAVFPAVRGKSHIGDVVMGLQLIGQNYRPIDCVWLRVSFRCLSCAHKLCKRVSTNLSKSVTPCKLGHSPKGLKFCAEGWEVYLNGFPVHSVDTTVGSMPSLHHNHFDILSSDHPCHQARHPQRA